MAERVSNNATQKSNAHSPPNVRRSRREAHPSVKLKEIQKDLDAERHGLLSPVTPPIPRLFYSSASSTPDRKVFSDVSSSDTVESQQDHSSTTMKRRLSSTDPSKRGRPVARVVDARTTPSTKTYKDSVPALHLRRDYSSPVSQHEKGVVDGLDSRITSRFRIRYILPSFSAETFMIYPWEAPKPQVPKDFLNLPADQRKWKAQIDAAEGRAYVDDGSDDWHDFAGNATDYESRDQFYFCIARMFVNRAKCAFRAGQSFEDFARAETVIDSQRHGNAAPDVAKKSKKMLAEALDNDLRLAILEAVSPRLCNEIWLHPYAGPPRPATLQKRDSKVDDAEDGIGGMHETDPPSKSRSKEQTKAGRSFSVGRSAVADWANLPMDMDTSEDELSIGM